MSMKYLPINKANDSSIGPGKYNSTNMNYYRFKSPSYKIGTALSSKKIILLSHQDLGNIVLNQVN